MNGYQEYLLIADHLIGKLWNVSSGSKKPPMNWKKICLACHTTPNMQNKYVVMDQGGQMDRKPAIVSMFDKYGYGVRQTAT